MQRKQQFGNNKTRATRRLNDYKDVPLLNQKIFIQPVKKKEKRNPQFTELGPENFSMQEGHINVNKAEECENLQETPLQEAPPRNERQAPRARRVACRLSLPLPIGVAAQGMFDTGRSSL